LLIVTDHGAHWLDDDLPQVRYRAERSATAESPDTTP